MEDFQINEGIISISQGSLLNIAGAVHIPSTVKEFGIYAMLGATEALDYDFQNAEKIGEYAFKRSKIRKLEFNEGVEICSNAFSYSELLTDLTLPEEFYVGENGAFQGCTNLVSVEVKSQVPPVRKSKETGETYPGLVIDTDVPSYCTLYVPKGSANGYRYNPAWANFKNIKEKDFSAIENTFVEDSGEYEVWNISGVSVARSNSRGKALSDLPAGIYVIKHGATTEKVAIR